MARTLTSFERDGILITGRIVYRVYNPSILGRVVKRGPGNDIEVHWIKTKNNVVENILGLRDYRSLVLDIEQKARAHRRALERAKKAP